MKRTKMLFFGSLMLSAGLQGTVMAQNQPPQAVNQQDEVVTIHLEPQEGAEKVLHILRSDSKLQTNRYVTEAFEVKNVEAYEIRNLIREAIQREEGHIRTARTLSLDGSPRRHFLVVTTTPAQMETIARTIESLDVPGLINAQGAVSGSVRLQHRLSSEVAELILATRATSQTRMTPDDRTNTLFYEDSPFVAEALLPWIKFYDVPTPQIEFDVRIIEVREDSAREVGLDWNAWKDTVSGVIEVSGSWLEGGNRNAQLDFLLGLDAVTLAKFLNYTVETGNARLVQRSRLNATNLEPAVISDRRRVPFFAYDRVVRPEVLLSKDDLAGTDDLIVLSDEQITNVLSETGTQTEGLRIEIQPVIGTSMVSAVVGIQMNTVTGFDQQGRPIITEQVLTNRFTVRNGEELLLGTLERRRDVSSRSGIPGLKDLPVIKYLTSIERQRTDASRIFILATPRTSSTTFVATTVDEVMEGVPVLGFSDQAPTILEDDGLESLPVSLDLPPVPLMEPAR
jgi:type II secretory pathway component GspD/PulD (secretin)